MITRQNLIDARALIADRKHWTKGIRERPTVYGTAYCAVGALDKATGRYNDRWLDMAPFYAIGIEDIVFYNDQKGHACTIAAFDAAIEKYGT